MPNTMVKHGTAGVEELYLSTYKHQRTKIIEGETCCIMETMKEDTTKRDKIFMILLIVSSVIVISANIAVNFFS